MLVGRIKAFDMMRYYYVAAIHATVEIRAGGLRISY